MAKLPLLDSTDSCKTCRFWLNLLSDFEDLAECHRNPPFYTRDMIRGELDRRKGATEPRYLLIQGAGKWPVTRSSDTCGEHEAAY